jgi:hypothetical protein
MEGWDAVLSASQPHRQTVLLGDARALNERGVRTAHGARSAKNAGRASRQPPAGKSGENDGTGATQCPSWRRYRSGTRRVSRDIPMAGPAVS